MNNQERQAVPFSELPVGTWFRWVHTPSGYERLETSVFFKAAADTWGREPEFQPWLAGRDAGELVMPIEPGGPDE